MYPNGSEVFNRVFMLSTIATQLDQQMRTHIYTYTYIYPPRHPTLLKLAQTPIVKPVDECLAVAYTHHSNYHKQIEEAENVLLDIVGESLATHYTRRMNVP